MKNITRTEILSGSMKLASLIDFNHHLLPVLSRFGIGLGFRDRTIEEACQKAGIDSEAFQIICNIYTYEGYVPARERLARADISIVIQYLRRSHQHYLGDHLNGMESSLMELMEPCDNTQKELIKSFLRGYYEEVDNHFRYEEEIVFPYVESLLSGDSPEDGFSISTFEDNHSNIEEKLGDLKNIVMKYLPDSCNLILRNALLEDIYDLEEDLRKHSFIEDNVFIPMVTLLEDRQLDEKQTKSYQQDEEDNELSEREKEILICVAKGMINKEIADTCNISVHTVITHRKNITRKIGIKTVAGLTVYALLNNLIYVTSVE